MGASGVLLRDEPTILGWELMHRPQWSVDTSTLTRAELSDFMSESTTLMSEATPQQLLFTGERGLDVNPTPYQTWAQQLETLNLGGLLTGEWGGDWSRLRSTISAVTAPRLISGFVLDDDTLHLPSDTSRLQAGQLWIRAHATAHISVDRPLTLHLTRLRRDVTPEEQQLQVLRQWIREARAQGLDGAIFGEVRLAIEGGSEGPYDWEYASPTTHSVISSLASDMTSLTP